MTAANDSWNPASSSVYGFHASRAAAPRHGVVGKPPAEPVGDACEPATPADETPSLRLQHHAHPVSSQPRSLVEAVLGPARQPHGANSLEHGALRWRSAQRKLELN